MDTSISRLMAALALVLNGCAAGTVSDIIGGMDASHATDATLPTEDIPFGYDVQEDAGPMVDTTPPPVCGDGLCTLPENCMTCPLDCNVCPICDMAPSCTGALAVPLTTSPLNECNNNASTNFVCGTDLGVPPASTDCADPQLRLRIQQISSEQGFFDFGSNIYCVVTAEDGMHSELLLTPPTSVAGNQHTTTINLPVEQSTFWGQSSLYPSISNITVTYQCYYTSNAAAASGVLNDIANRAGMAAASADGYGWVFGTVSVLSGIIGSVLGTIGDSTVIDVQQTIAAGALLNLTNGRTWTIEQRMGNLDLSGASDVRLTIESWGCANVRVTTP